MIGSAEGRDAGAEIFSGVPQTYCDDESSRNLVKMQIPLLSLGSEAGSEVLHVYSAPTCC